MMARRGSTFPWRGELFLERGWLLYDGPVAPTSLHAHHAVQIILAWTHPLEITDGQQRRVVELAVIPRAGMGLTAPPTSTTGGTGARLWRARSARISRMRAMAADCKNASPTPCEKRLCDRAGY